MNYPFKRQTENAKHQTQNEKENYVHIMKHTGWEHI